MSSSDLTRVIGNIGKMAATIERAPRDVVAAEARIFKDATQAAIFAVAPGGRLRHVGKKGSKVGVTSRITESSLEQARAVVQATGQLQIIEKDTKAHTIPRTRTQRRTRTSSGRLSKTRADGGKDISGRKWLVINGTLVLGPVNHPGTKGKHPFERGVHVAEIPAALAAHQVLSAPISRIFL